MTSSDTFFTINKNVFFKTIKDSFETNELLLEAVKKDLPRMRCTLNKIHYDSYVDFMEAIRTICPQYLERLLLLTNQNAHFLYLNTVFGILSKHNLHIVCETGYTNDKHLYTTQITINPMVHQVVLENIYKVIDIKPDDIHVLRYCKIITVVDLMVLDPVLIQIHYIDTLE